MGKLLSWVALIALVWLAFRLIAISQRRRQRAQADPGPADAAAAGSRKAPAAGVSGELIVPCTHCGVFLPASDALREEDRAYCSRAHRDADRERERGTRRSGSGASQARQGIADDAPDE